MEYRQVGNTGVFERYFDLAACNDCHKAVAWARWVGESFAFRELIAKPSASRTVGQTSTPMGTFRSATIRWTTTVCW